MNTIVVYVVYGVDGTIPIRYEDAYSFQVGEAGQLSVVRLDGRTDLYAPGRWFSVVTPEPEVKADDHA